MSIMIYAASNESGPGSGAVESTPEQVRSTVDLGARPDAAVSPEAPVWNRADVDSSDALRGLHNTQVASAWTPSVQSSPVLPGKATEDYNGRVDSQVATSGGAAQRELTGARGHGTMAWAEGIEPVIRDGAAFGSTMFQSVPLAVQDGAGDYMNPAVTDGAWAAVAQQLGTDQARDAYQASVVGDWYQRVNGG